VNAKLANAHQLWRATRHLAVTGLLGCTAAALSTTCNGTTIADSRGWCGAGGWCLCRAACKGLPAGATPEKLASLGDYLCNSTDCPANHACDVTAWSPTENVYYGKCNFACDGLADCLPGQQTSGSVACAVRDQRETMRAGICLPNAFDLCAVKSLDYDCHTQIMDYVVSCDDTMPHEHPGHVHIGPE
jgi:hypothetical protein